MLSTIFARCPTVRAHVRRAALAALAVVATAAAPSSAGAAGNETQLLKGEGSTSTVKLPARSPGPDSFDELANSASTEAAGGVTPMAVTRSACILPFTKVKFPISLKGKGAFTFATTPSRQFDVVMALDFPGLHRRVDRYYGGGTERYKVIKNFTALVNGKVTISGAGNSYGCFILKITP